MPIHCRRWLSVGLQLVVAGWLVVGLSGQAQEHGRYATRAYQGNADAPGPWPVAEHRQFVERVLLIRDPALLDRVAAWQLPRILARTGVASHTPLVGAMAGLITCGSPAPCLDADRFPLQAVVNRFDLARIRTMGKGPMVAGLEVRFVYGHRGAGGAADVLMIVEFVLRPMEVWRLAEAAREWARLAGEPQKPEALVEKTLSQVESARVRLEVLEMGRSGSWKFHQFNAVSGQWSAADLTGEVAAAARYDARARNLKTSDVLTAYIRRNERRIRSGDYELDVSLRTKRASVSRDEQALTLSAGVAPAGHLEEIRHALSLNTCTGCHGAETHVAGTGTGFFQIGLRPAGAPSPLSRFLGGGPEAGTVNTGLWRVNPLRRSQMSLDGTGYRYNDLRRRHEFFDAVLDLGKRHVRAIDVWDRVLERFQAQQSH